MPYGNTSEQEQVQRRGAKTIYITTDVPWGNLYSESSSDKLCDECLKMHMFWEGRQAQEVVKAWRREYNERCPPQQFELQDTGGIRREFPHRRSVYPPRDVSAIRQGPESGKKPKQILSLSLVHEPGAGHRGTQTGKGEAAMRRGIAVVNIVVVLCAFGVAASGESGGACTTAVQVSASPLPQRAEAALRLEECDAYVAWCTNVHRLNALRLTYRSQSAWRCRAQNVESTRDASGSIPWGNSGVVGILRVSRLGESLDRKKVLERFEFDWGEPGNATPGDGSGLRGLREGESYVEIHGDGIYFGYSPDRHIGAVWPRWDTRTDYPVATVVPPDPTTTRLVRVLEPGNVLDFVTDFDDLYRYFTVEQYARTINGAILPAEATIHDLARMREDGSIDEKIRKTYLMTGYEEDVQFGPNEFTYDFPEGTRVRDNR